MMLTFALVVLCCAFGVLFSKELAEMLKKLFAMPGVKVALPLFIVNVFLIQFEPVLHMVFLYIKAELHTLIGVLASWLPFGKGSEGTVTVLLMVFVPMFCTALVSYLYFKRNYKEFPYAIWVSSHLWLFLIILLTVPAA